MRTHTGICILALLFLIAVTSVSAEVRIGVLGTRGSERTNQDWSALGDCLSKVMGKKVALVAVTHDGIAEFGRTNADQFVLADPWQFLRVRNRLSATPILSVSEKGQGTTVGGVIFARRESGITSVQDLRNKSVACVKFTSGGGWLFQKAVLLKNEVHPESDCKALVETGASDAVVHAVRDGRADVGTVGTGVLERMCKEGHIRIDDYVILNPVRHAGLDKLCSTSLYPTWPLASLGGARPGDVEALKAALLSIPEGHPALESAGLARFVEPLDYAPYHDLAVFLKSAGRAAAAH